MSVELAVTRALQNYFNRTKDQKSDEEDDKASYQNFKHIVATLTLEQVSPLLAKCNQIANTDERVRRHFLNQWEKKYPEKARKASSTLEKRHKTLAKALQLPL
ncbi:hypothetical protein KVR01_006015 [Diaporthe batatas]|uniref:uncharacterized protein n=1 Tax=Diaporthe batatas TaxID=748121 RepID=UPI001D05AAE4|nr:uncharacterized protein KVR01_006015 [Diaporthe batatas]KAG8164097.1 hypothetical protein KVR01_006015 [Diaporthe batatas]